MRVKLSNGMEAESADIVKKQVKLSGADKIKAMIDQDYETATTTETSYGMDEDLVGMANQALQSGKELNRDQMDKIYMSLDANEKNDFLRWYSQIRKKNKQAPAGE